MQTGEIIILMPKDRKAAVSFGENASHLISLKREV